MPRRIAALLAAALLSAAVPARAADVTVASLLAEGYTVVSSFMSQLGPGLFLQRGASLYLCFVEETPSTPALTTKYCKKVE